MTLFIKILNCYKLIENNDVVSFATRKHNEDGKIIGYGKASLGYEIHKKYGFKFIIGGRVWGSIFKITPKIMNFLYDRSKYYEDLVPTNLINNYKHFKIIKTNIYFIEYLVRKSSISHSSQTYEMQIQQPTNFKKLLDLNVLPDNIQQMLIYDIKNMNFFSPKITLEILKIKKSIFKFFKPRQIALFVYKFYRLLMKK